MRKLAKTAAILAGGVLGCLSTTAAQSTATIRNVSVFGTGSHVEVEVVASRPVAPQAQVITGPDRLILDFPNSQPGDTLRNLTVDRGELKGVRVGRFSATPPVTRIVLDLKSAQPYQIFPSGKTVIVKLAAPKGSGAALVQTSTPMITAPAQPAAAPAPRVQVDFSNGKLRIWANKASLAEVLSEVRHHTGAELVVPPGAAQEQVVADLGPAPARDVLAALLNGSPFNFVMIGSDQDSSQLRGIFLTMRNGGGGGDNSVSYPAIVVNNDAPQPGSEPSMQMPEEPPMAEPDVPAQPDAPPAEETPQPQ